MRNETRPMASSSPSSATSFGYVVGEGYLLSSLQILMIKAARYVTGNRNFVSTRKPLLKCGWQLFYKTVILTHKMKITKSPHYLWEKMNSSYPYRTSSQLPDV